MFQSEVGKRTTSVGNDGSVIILIRKVGDGLPVEFVSDNIGLIDYSADDLMSGDMVYGDIIHLDDREWVGSMYSRIIDGLCDEFDMDYRVITGSGDIRWLEEKVIARRDADGNISQLYSVIFDKTNNKNLDAKLQLKLSNLEGRSKELRCFYDVSNACEEIDNFEELLQKTADIIPSGWQYPDFVCSRIIFGDKVFQTDNFRETSWKQFANIDRRGTNICSLEVFYLKEIPGDSKDIFLQEEVKLLDAISKRLGDAYESRIAKKALSYYAKVLAEDVDCVKGEFLANMNHEMRTPLNSIIGFSDILLSGNFGQLNDKQSKYLSNISSSGKQLLEMVNNILDISKIESGDVDMKYEDISLPDILDDLQSLLEPMISRKKIMVESHVDEGMDTIKVDRIKFRHILYNLMNNAVKFTPDGGSVVINACKIGNRAQIDVRDTGIGFPEKDINRMFEPFVQLNSFTNSKYPGAGIGLALVDRYVKMHGGDVRVESEPGKGSKFTVSMPLTCGSQ